MKHPRQSVAVLILVALALSSVPVALADSGRVTRVASSYERDGVRYYEGSVTLTQPGDPNGGPTPNLVGGGSGSGWSVEWRNVISSNAGPAEWVRYVYARSKRLTGTGSYGFNAHATLIRGASYGGEQVFSSYTHSCATKTVSNQTAQTCQSPQFNTSPGNQWLVVSGHWYDHGNNGSHEATCSGCIDWVWTASSS